MNRFWDLLLRDITEAARARCIVEVGVASGKLTRKVLDYCASVGAVLHAIDPEPQIDPEKWRDSHGGRLIFHRARSLEVLGGIHDADVVFLDGDHNWFTVYHELRLLENTSVNDGSLPPIIALHDVDWPYGRRDMYYDPDSVPEAHRQPHRKLGLVPGETELTEDGLNADLNNAISGDSAHNGVRTALEDFGAESELDWQLFYVHGFHGLGVAVTKDRLDQNEELQRALESLRTPRFLETQVQNLELARIDLELARVRAVMEGDRQLAEERDSHARSMASLLDRVEERDRLNELLVDAERRVAAVPDLELRIADLERELADANKATETAREDARLLDERLTRGQRVLTDVFNSPSWRLTKPLRRAKHLLSRS